MKYQHKFPPLGTRFMRDSGWACRMKVSPKVWMELVWIEEVPPDEEEDYGSVLPDPKPQRPKGR